MKTALVALFAVLGTAVPTQSCVVHVPPDPGSFAGSRCDPWIGGSIFIGTDVFLVSDVHMYAVPATRNVYIYERTRESVETSTSRSPTHDGTVRDSREPKSDDAKRNDEQGKARDR